MSLTKSEKANPPKDGDAKPWIYCHAKCDYDSQVAEDKLLFDFCEPGMHQALSI
jgi:hypothetical protein